jgi:hypothetical protein
MNIEELKSEIKSIDTLFKDGIIDEETAKRWKQRTVNEFEDVIIPKDKPKELPNDFAHFPGRLVGGMINALGTIAKNSGDRIAQIEEEDKKKKSKNVMELYSDLEKRM